MTERQAPHLCTNLVTNVIKKTDSNNVSHNFVIYNTRIVLVNLQSGLKRTNGVVESGFSGSWLFTEIFGK